MSGLCCWCLLIGVDGLRSLSHVFLDGGVIYEPASTIVYLEQRLTIAPQYYLWVALVLASFFMFWQYQRLIVWPKTNCVPFIKKIPKRTHSILQRLFYMFLSCCVCVRLCFKLFHWTQQVHEPKLIYITWSSKIDALIALEGWLCSGCTLVF